MPLRIVMMGTGAFALPAFRALVDSEHDVVALVTQPDRTGRGHHQHVNPLKDFALERKIEVFQPEKVKTEEALDLLRSYQADLFVVAAYGQILSNKLLAIPRLGAINVHGSILPKYRGAAPIQYAIWKGEWETGVSIFQIVKELDAGPIFGIATTPIHRDETYGELHDRLAEFSVGITLEIVNQLDSGTAIAAPQNDSLATFAPRIQKEEGLINWSQSTEEIGWHIRAMQPWPNPFTFLHQADKKPVRIIILKIQPYHRDMRFDHLAPGELLTSTDNELLVRTGDGLAKIVTLQPAGKRSMAAEDFLRGTTIVPGDKLASA